MLYAVAKLSTWLVTRDANLSRIRIHGYKACHPGNWIRGILVHLLLEVEEDGPLHEEGLAR